MGTITLIIILAWIPQAIRQFLRMSYWVQEKEYRFDRFKAFFSSKRGKKELEVVYILLKVFLILISPSFIPPLLFFLFLDALLLSELVRRIFRRPVFTQRIIKIMATTLILTIPFFIVGFYFSGIPMGLILGETGLLLGIPVGVLITKPIVEKVKRQDIQKAKNKLKKVKPKVIGITGSYGKTTTKDFTATILSEKYKTEKTTKNQNNEFGVARKIINDFSDDTEVFVAEMGAYKKGEIKVIADFIHPDYGVITGIEPQHLDLFGSIENIMDAKFELIESLPKKGTAVFNLNNEHCIDLYEKAEELENNLNVLGYFVKEDKKSNLPEEVNPEIVSEIISVDSEKIKFKVKMGKKSKNISVKLHGAHFIENLTAAILTARKMGVSWKKIEKGLEKIKNPQGTMRVYQLESGATVIDDSYNSTPTGFKAALNYLSLFRGRKIVITPGIIELGDEADKIHTELGGSCSDLADEFVFVDKQNGDYFKKGIEEKKDKIKTIESTTELKDVINKIIEEKVTILIEGVIPSAAYKMLKEQE